MSANITKALAVACEMTGTDLSKAAFLAFESNLAAYPEPAVIDAIGRCCKELTGRLTLAAIISRIEQKDGRPSANEAWAIALKFFDEEATVVLNQEIAEACSIAKDVMDAGDETGARMAFRDAYERILQRNRDQGINPVWYASLGHSTQEREKAISQAVSLGRLTAQQATHYLPPPMTERGAAIAGLLTGSVDPAEIPDDIRSRIEQLKAILRGDKQ